MSERQRQPETERQSFCTEIDKQKNRQANRQTIKHIETETDRETETEILWSLKTPRAGKSE